MPNYLKGSHTEKLVRASANEAAPKPKSGKIQRPVATPDMKTGQVWINETQHHDPALIEQVKQRMDDNHKMREKLMRDHVMARYENVKPGDLHPSRQVNNPSECQHCGAAKQVCGRCPKCGRYSCSARPSKIMPSSKTRNYPRGY